MLYPSINEIRKKADSRYTLVILAAKRARDIIDGKPILTDVDIDKPVSIAAHEIAEDLITYNRNENVPANDEAVPAEMTAYEEGNIDNAVETEEESAEAEGSEAEPETTDATDAIEE